MHLSLKAGERIFINGAVLRVDRKVSIELLNDATFLLENHVLQVEDATTPLRQLYFVAQALLIDPSNSEKAKSVYEDLHRETQKLFTHREIINGLKHAAEMIDAGRAFDALKIIRGLFVMESAILPGEPEAKPIQAA
ncbi:flagellar biosynthesis repressor FlbT [Microvirga terricola]|uniref:Flagellar biosynthesis repressor FlbT n=1 Tax=Microvirga terricola TaxID=2719797 RepID=A0ABX0VFG0_9HYPH|nr:flagellar biosynthesis repressor FlbT [Microvirga terricola]NIX78412.1 flagellar biosynthesis repressor FlbT [Microvirga terricola]